MQAGKKIRQYPLEAVPGSGRSVWPAGDETRNLSVAVKVPGGLVSNAGSYRKKIQLPLVVISYLLGEFWLLAPCTLLAGDCSVSRKPLFLAFQTKVTPQSQKARSRLSRVVKIPVVLFDGKSPIASTNKSAVEIAPAGHEELPHGPRGFDVLDDGGFVIADPLRDRLAFYDASGAFRQEWPTEVPVFTVRAVNGGFDVRGAHGSDFYIDKTRRTKSIPVSPSAPSNTRIDASRTHAYVKRLDGKGEITVASAGADDKIMSARTLDNSDGNTYLVVETSRSSSGEIRVAKSIQRYSPDGRMIAGINDLPEEHYLHPRDEFRVRRGFVYQLMPLQTELQINVWDLTP